MKGLQERFIEVLKLSKEDAIFPELAPYFVALGSAYFADTVEKEFEYDEVVQLLSQKKEKKVEHLEKPLFTSEEEYEFLKRHQKMTVPTKDITSYSGKAYLGLDSGSTTIKVVLLDDEENILYRYYSSSKGNPVSLFLEQLKNS